LPKSKTWGISVGGKFVSSAVVFTAEFTIQ